MTRTPLPNRRPHESFDFFHWSRRFTAGIGRPYNNGPIKEVWIGTGRSGEQMEALARDAAVLMSLALQHQTPLEAMQHAVMRDMDGNASSPIGALVDLLISKPPESAPVLPDPIGPKPTPALESADA